jgi:ABC-type glycerol-3-phosphate transport system permease component
MTRQRVVTVMTHVALLVSGLAWLYPLFWALGSSLKSDDDFFSDGLNPMPSHFLWANYLTAWQEASFSRYFMNTILITFGTVVST